MNASWQTWAHAPRWQQCLGLLLLSSGILLMAALGLWRPLWQAHAQAQRQEPILRQTLQRQQQQAQQHPLWTARLPLAEAALSQQQNRLPSTPVDLTQPIHQLVVAHGLSLKQIRPLPVTSLAELSVYPYDLSSSGEVGAVLGFLRQLRDHPDGLILTQLALSLSPNQTPPTLNLEAQLHTLRQAPHHLTQEPTDAAP